MGVPVETSVIMIAICADQIAQPPTTRRLQNKTGEMAFVIASSGVSPACRVPSGVARPATRRISRRSVIVRAEDKSPVKEFADQVDEAAKVLQEPAGASPTPRAKGLISTGNGRVISHSGKRGQIRFSSKDSSFSEHSSRAAADKAQR